MKDPFQVVRDFEAALCEYTGARFAVTTTSCTSALLLACAFHKRDWEQRERRAYISPITIPKRTYVGVAMSIMHAGYWPRFDDSTWSGSYRLNPLPVFDCARRFFRGMCVHNADYFDCVSFHPSKILGISTHGGAILHDNPEADAWLRRARFDGRAEGILPRLDVIAQFGWHCYMNPVTAAEGLERLSRLPARNTDLPNSDYPDLSTLEVFK